MKTACAYFRTSSATNVGVDKDSLRRQQEAVQAYAQAQGLAVVRQFYDAAVSGADGVLERPGFAEMLAYMLGNGARVVLVENASRFARDLAVQIAGHDLLKAKGIELIPVDAPTHFTEDTPTATMVRNILGAVSQFEKQSLVAKLRKARDHARAAKPRSSDRHRCEGNPNWTPVPPAAVVAAQAARKRGLSLRAAAAALADAGMLGRSGKPYAAASIRAMLRAG